jgi:hypothetical protein
METLSVEADDAGGFLAAMLKGVEAKGGDGGGIGMAVDAEHAAFLAQPVAIHVELAAWVREFRHVTHRPSNSLDQRVFGAPD